VHPAPDSYIGSFTMFSDANGHLPTERKLALLEDEVTPEWRPEMINLIVGVDCGTTWTARDQCDRVREGHPPRVATDAPARAANPR
jgi:hypothetical protein